MSKLFNGDCLEKLGEIQSAYVDAIITDPPYGLSFMDKKWDYDVPSVAIWKECLRVIKPGGHLLSFSSARTYHRMACNVEDAGFEIRDQIMWVYGSGFPKGKTQLKPSHEPIVMARKGGKKQELRIDDCRVPGKLEGDPNRFKKCDGGRFVDLKKESVVRSEGRWPANLIHDGSEEVINLFPEVKTGDLKPYKRTTKSNIYERNFNENSTYISKGSNGSAARFFYCAKASNSDRGKGNNHPTVKPIDLMRYLIRLVCPVGSVVLDPFMGSGTTGKAALEEGMEFIGIEQSAEYMDISKKRLTNVAYQAGLFA
jgi:site-specific DNA-methyltransferase (adenine-specific)